jgi:hypothetical protein
MGPRGRAKQLLHVALLKQNAPRSETAEKRLGDTVLLYGDSSFRARFATCPAYCARYAIFCSIVVTGPYPSSVRLRLNDFLKLSME